MPTVIRSEKAGLVSSPATGKGKNLYYLITILQILLIIYVYFFVRRVLAFYGVNVHSWYGMILPAAPALIIIRFAGSIWGTGFMVVIHLVGLSLLADLTALIARHAFAGSKETALYRFGHILYRCGILPFLLTAVVLSYGYSNMHHIIRTEYTIKTSKAVSEYSIVLLTDIHYDTIQPKELLKKTVEEISAMEPDLVILGGDIVEERTSRESMEEVFEVLGGIKSRYGIYYVFGNHDRQPYTSNKAFTSQELEDAAEAGGIRILRDEWVKIAGELTLAGRDDAGWNNTSGRMSAEDLLSGTDPDTFIIVADHQPIEYEQCAQNGADLELSGHTHAGQIWPVGTLTELDGSLNYGLYHKDGIDVIVSSGIAGWGYSIRTEKHCEYVVVHLIPEDGVREG